MNYLVSYDIVDDRRRVKLSDLLESYGTRVNYSVYECQIDKTRLRHLLQKIETGKLVDPKTDSLRLYHICQNCLSKSFKIGQHSEPFDQDDMFL